MSAPQQKRIKSVKENPRMLAFYSYLSFLCLIPLLKHRENRFVHFHSRQGLLLWIWTMGAIFLLFIPVIGGAFFVFSAYVIGGLSLFGMVSVVLNRTWSLPLIGKLAKKL
ncbi:MAG: hypothetical protein HQL53_14640 [Magnetococcales bacterium]|nr:hypothetical protein [Magnetococcales bacterium]